MGATFALTVVVPLAVKFLVSYKTENLVPTLSVNRYVDFILKFTLAFGLIFELPLALTLGRRLGLVTPEFLAKNRKYAYLLCFVAAAILTPTPDAFNQVLMAGPLMSCFTRRASWQPGCSAAGSRGGRLTRCDSPSSTCRRRSTRASGPPASRRPRPIQEAALPVALRGKDVAGQAQTGHRQDGGVPDRDVHAAPPAPPAGTRDGRAARPHHRAHA